MKMWYNRGIPKSGMGEAMSQEIILVVSDKQQTREFLGWLPGSSDNLLLVVEGAAQAIAALDEHRVAAVILDRPLTRVWDVVHHARQVQPGVPILGLLAPDDDEALADKATLEKAQRADELVLLNAVGQAMAATMDSDEILQLLLQAVDKAIGADECVVALWDEATQSHVPRIRLLEGQMSAAGESNTAPPSLDVSLPSIRISLVWRDRVLGLLALGQRFSSGELGLQDLQLAQALANQAASALENARLYAELKQFAGELERSQQSLVQSEKLAATGRLAASIAHEINNPLQAIRNCLELILDEADAGEPLDRAYLDVSLNELGRIRHIIQQMLDLYRPEKGRMAPIDLNAAVEGVLALMRKQLESGRIVVATHLDSARPHVIGRGDQARQVFINLILNAIEAMPEGGQLTLTTHQGSDGIVAIQIADTGMGIAPENLTRIAEPFFTTKPKGVGLGLTVCYEIIERHQGTLDVISKVGHGSTFTIRLPAAG
jgi:signal transduction histidine kinase